MESFKQHLLWTSTWAVFKKVHNYFLFWLALNIVSVKLYLFLFENEYPKWKWKNVLLTHFKLYFKEKFICSFCENSFCVGWLKSYAIGNRDLLNLESVKSEMKQRQRKHWSTHRKVFSFFRTDRVTWTS